MKHKLTLFLFFVFTATFFSQRISIEWNGSKVQDYGETKINLPFFKNEGFSYSQNTIFYQNKNAIGEKELKFSNLSWETVSKNELFDITVNNIPDYDVTDISYYNFEGTNYANFRVGLFKKSGNKILRLSSFTLTESTPLDFPNPSMFKTGSTVNPLSSGGFYKIKVDKSGIFKIDKNFLQTIGVNPSSINPKNMRIYGNGGIMLPEYNRDVRYSALQENAIQVVGEDDNTWNDGDYALFYAQGPTGYNLYNNGNGNGFSRMETRNDRPNHVKNIYEDFSYYFITFDKGPGKRVLPQDTALPTTPLVTQFDAYQFINNDELNLLKLGRTWVEQAPINADRTITFSTQSPLIGGDNIRYRTQAIGFQAQNTSITFDINGQNTLPVTVPQNTTNVVYDYYIANFQGTLTSLQGSEIKFNYKPDITANPNANFYLNYVEVQYKQDLKFNGTQMSFRDFSLQSGSNTGYGFSMSNTGNLEQIWDVTDITNATKKVNKATGNTIFNFGYIASNQDFNNEFVAFRADAAFTPQFVEKIANQDLSALSNVDYLIITTPEMMSQAQRLANYHQTNNNYNVQIVDVNKIYNEFSSGSKDITAIRDFVTRLNTTNGLLKYVFILGDTTYDYKNRTPNNYNIIPSYESEESSDFVNSYVSDDYFVMTSPQFSPSSTIKVNLPNIPIGRIPAANITEAKNMMDKTLAYYNKLPNQSTPFGEWRTKLDFVVDDDKDGGAPFHDIVNQTLVPLFESPTSNLKEYNVRKLYTDAFTPTSTSGGRRYPQVNQAITNDFSNSLYMFYFGHGGINGWAQERIFVGDDIANLNNFNNIFSRLPLVCTITCEFTLWDEPNIFSAGEQVMKKANGGASTMITSSRAVQVDYGAKFTTTLTNNLFLLVNDDFQSIGISHLQAKRQYGTAGGEHLKVNFLGDPAMKLARPSRRIVLDNIDTPVPGLIRALDFVKITGHVNNAAGAVNTSFNGRVVINIFDKKQDKHTLNNPGNLTPILNYKEEGSPIVKASGTVVNGVFTVEFYVPKDINYTIGEGRILAYADNKVFDVFQNQAAQVGDINPHGVNDNEPPKVRLYMNNTNFANGGITNRNPSLLACITDDTGINSTGAGIGHDITTYLDGQIINTIVLNDFYSPGESNGCLNPNLKDFQKGSVMYPFRNLSVGDHQLTFKVWDINNNSTTATLNFTVKDEADQSLVINRPLNWPNPFTNKTYIQFEHNCDDILDVNVQIYTITGKLVKTISQTVIAEPYLQGYRTPRQAIEWDGKDDFGATVAKGTYIFKIFAKSQNQEKCKGSATALEKMVLLK